MASRIVTCVKCQATLLGEGFNSGSLQPCPACRTPIRVDVFPALFKAMERGSGAETLLTADEASCYYHPQKRAAVSCESCGRFLCALCDVELNGQHLCPNCLDAGRKKGKLKNLENERTLYDNIALSLAVLPLLIWPFTLITAPAAIFVALRFWNAPSSLVPRTKTRFILAILFALAELGGWCMGIYAVFFRR